MQQDLKMEHDNQIRSFHETQLNQNLDDPKNADIINNDEPKKGNRQQKRKEKKALQMQQAYEEAKEEADQSVDYKQLEESDILNQLNRLDLKIKEVGSHL